MWHPCPWRPIGPATQTPEIGPRVESPEATDGAAGLGMRPAGRRRSPAAALRSSLSFVVVLAGLTAVPSVASATAAGAARTTSGRGSIEQDFPTGVGFLESVSCPTISD